MRQCRICKTILTTNNTYRYIVRQHRICKTCESKRDKDKKLRLKQETFAEYGGKCVCCGEKETVFLTIDHINNDGNIERKRALRRGKHLKGSNFYCYLKKRRYPKTNYQLLCWNCNAAKHILGICPHQQT
jgi:hypothetical protein